MGHLPESNQSLLRLQGNSAQSLIRRRKVKLQSGVAVGVGAAVGSAGVGWVRGMVCGTSVGLTLRPIGPVRWPDQNGDLLVMH